MIMVKRSTMSEVGKLGVIQRGAFENLEKHFATESDDSIKSKMNRNNNIHNFTIYKKDTIIGGARVLEYKNNVFYLEKIFIGSSYQNNGYGKNAMLMIEDYFPYARIWTLNSQKKNKRFYKKLGYTIVKKQRFENDTYYLFQKEMCHNTKS